MTSLINGENPLLALWVKKYGLEVEGIVHVGAHLAQERYFYKKQGFEPVFWVEAIPEIAIRATKLLENFPNQQLINAALWSKNGVELDLNITNGEAASSSLLELHLHKSSHPDVILNKKIKVKTTTLDSLLKGSSKYNTLILDTQGAELEILKGSTNSLRNIDQIVCEISIRELYKGAPKLKQIEKFMFTAGYSLVAADINRTVGWGDGLFLRNEKAITFDKRTVNENIKYKGKRFTLGTLLRNLLIRIGIYEKIVKLIGKR